MSYFAVENLTCRYGKKAVLEGVSFSLEPGTVTGLLGANGAGKTTLFQSICGLLPHRGRCLLEGQALESLRPRQLGNRISYIPQKSSLFPDLPALEVVLMAYHSQLRLLQAPTRQMKAQAAQALALVGLAGREQENFQTFSQGEKQLCLFARAFCAPGKLLLLDEPESALDLRRRRQMLAMARDRIRKEQIAGLVSLHDPQLALNSCQKLLLLHNGTITAQLLPQSQSPEELAKALAPVYGPVEIVSLETKQGRQLVLLPQEDL